MCRDVVSALLSVTLCAACCFASLARCGRLRSLSFDPCYLQTTASTLHTWLYVIESGVVCFHRSPYATFLMQEEGCPLDGVNGTQAEMRSE